MINGIYFISNFPFHLLVYVTLLILPQNMFSCHNWVMHQRFPIEILPMHIHSSNLMIFICRIVINTLVALQQEVYNVISYLPSATSQQPRC